MSRYDFANILLSGPCNLSCPQCIGRRVASRLRVANLDRFPLAGFDRFCELLLEHRVRQLSLTGIDTDPQLYHHEGRLLDELRRRLPAVSISLHTNGMLALRRLNLLNRYNRACLSIPSLRPATCRLMTGSDRVVALERILDGARIPIKVSTLVNEHNLAEVPTFLERCRELGVRRVVLRRLYGDTRPWDLLPGRRPVSRFGGNPVYDLDGLEVTVWSFSGTDLRCLNLFPDGSISDEYELVRS